MYKASDRAVVVQDVEELWEDVAYALNSYEISLLATNKDVAELVEPFAPLTTKVRIDPTRYREL